MSEVLSAKNLGKSYHDGQRELKILTRLNLTVAAGEAVAIVGMSGAGKSTLLHLLGGLDRPSEGEISFDGENVAGYSRAKMSAFRNKNIGFVFQFHHLLPEFDAVENVMMPALVARRPRAEARTRALELLKDLGLAERSTHRPGKLSGGEQQRVALARALMNEPRLVLADEPTGNLDVKTGARVIDALWGATVGKGRSLIIVTHEPAIAEKADRIFLLRAGRLDSLGRTDVAGQVHAAQAAADQG